MKSPLEQQYSVNIHGFRFGKNEVEFQIENAFFAAFEHSPIQEGKLTAKVIFQKYESHLDAQFEIRGTVQVPCDRCMEEITIPLESKQRVIYSFDTDMKETGDTEILYIQENEPDLVLLQDLYDFICISIPFRNVHEDIGQECDPAIMKYIITSDEEEENDSETDPRWDALKKLSE